MLSVPHRKNPKALRPPLGWLQSTESTLYCFLLPVSDRSFIAPNLPKVELQAKTYWDVGDAPRRAPSPATPCQRPQKSAPQHGEPHGSGGEESPSD